ncbi:MAG: TetR/AcrR family transcriptional regulator [Desulfobaccales bacterium]
MPFPPKPTKKEVVTAFRTREILAAARKLMEQRGLEDVTIEEIAGAAGVAKGTIYLYFPSKDELIQALITQIGESMLQDIEGIVKTPGSPPETIHRVASLLLDYLSRERTLFPVYARDSQQSWRGSHKGYWRRLREMEEKFLELMIPVFNQGIAQGLFIPANPRLLTFMLRGLARSVGYYQMTEGQDAAVKEALPVLLTLLSSGLTPKFPMAAEVTHL